jgi:hypothetical protein
MSERRLLRRLETEVRRLMRILGRRNPQARNSAAVELEVQATLRSLSRLRKG